MRRLLIVAVAGLLLGCQQTPAKVSSVTSAETPGAGLRAAGDALMATGEYEAAVAKYVLALDIRPADVALRYALGTAYSHLGRRAETIQQFRWVVTQGVPGSPEVNGASKWLARAGVTLANAAAPVAPQPEPDPDSAAVKTMVKGKLEWKDFDRSERFVAVHVSLTGEDASNRDQKLLRRFRMGERYGFANVPPGNYRLVAKAGDMQLWDQRLLVEASKDTVLDLNSGNSLVPPEALPTMVAP